ncbi:MAG TPA: ATPase [Coriobacteriia bacterium]|nr:ATPase [Coriobacteriia bacterium]
MYYPRHIEAVLQRMERRKSVLVLTGARQVGKSTMLKTVHSGMGYIALDSPLVRQSALDAPSIFFEMHKPPIIVDEIQKAGLLFEYIKVYVDESGEKGQFYLSGSQSFRLMQGVSESLAGRAGVIKMLGLSLRELDFSGFREPFLPTLEKIEGRCKAGISGDYQTTVERIHAGFFPELHEVKGDLCDWRDYYSSYLQTYIEKDIKDVLRVHDESAFVKFVRACASLTGQILNVTTLAEACGKDVTTARRWLSVLESSGLVYLLQPYHNNYLKRLVKTPKLYFLDTGFACWLLGWNTPEQLVNGAMWGHIFETFVVGEVLKSYYNDGLSDAPLFYYRNKDKREIDLVIKEGGVLYPVEIKTTGDPDKRVLSAFDVLDNIPGIERGTGAVICMTKNVLPLTGSEYMVPAWLI